MLSCCLTTLFLPKNPASISSRARNRPRSPTPSGALTAALTLLRASSTGSALSTVARPQSLADEAHRQLLLQLDMGLWKAGDKLPAEKALADSLGRSRPHHPRGAGPVEGRRAH